MFAIVDIYSRYVVHADVFDSESAENAVKFLEDAIKKHHIKPRALVLHSDNGAAMKAASTLACWPDMRLNLLEVVRGLAMTILTVSLSSRP